MSVPHTGQLTCLIDGHRYQFDGDQWTGPDPSTVQDLQIARSFVPTTHLDIRDIAQQCGMVAGLDIQIQAIEYNTWHGADDLPEEAID